MARRIVIMAGGTGGHVFPALAVAERLRSEGWQVSWLGTRSGLESRVVPERGFDIDWLPVAGFRGKGLWNKLLSVPRLLASCLKAWRILGRRQPQVVLGMGGFVAGPGGLMAKLRGIPLVIHEQNRIPGTTNRLLAGLAAQVLEAFPDSFDKRIGAVCTGNPLRAAFTSMPEKSGVPAADVLRILVVGGSQGAKVLNEIMPETAVLLSGVRIRQQTGAAMCDAVARRYRELSVEAEVTAFIEAIDEAYRWADLVICRSGAMTVSEIAAAGIPAVFVPFPYAIDDHQTANARYLVDAGAALMLPEPELTPEKLAECIHRAANESSAMGRAARACARLDAAEKVADFCRAEAGT